MQAGKHPCSEKSLAEDVFRGGMHPYSKKCSLRDAFRAAEASLFGGIRRQGLFSRDECIPIRRNSSPGIIFPETDTSLFDEKSAAGCFSSGEYIPIRKNSSPRIIFQRRMHPYSEEFVARDYFPETDTSLFDEKFAEGCFSKGKSIPQGHESTLGIH